MPEGIVVEVDEGFATLDFVDQSLRGLSLHKLLEIGGPATIETITRKGPRRLYRVPEGNAREAGLLDEPSQARGLNADGSPSENATGGSGTTTATVDVGANDTGFAAKLKAADPNVNPGLDKENWHTPTAEYTSANKFVGTVPNATVLHSRDQVFTGLGTSDGGSTQHPPTHAALIETVEAYTKGANYVRAVVREETPVAREPQVPAAHIAGALRDQPGALASDPGGYAPQPENAPEAVSLPQGRVVSPEPPQPAEEPSGPTKRRPRNLPEGFPDDSWKRAEINAYAEWVGLSGVDELPNKAEALAAIQKGS